MAVVAAVELQDLAPAGERRAPARSALMVASVPEETKRTFSIEGTRRTTRSASSTSAAQGAPYEVPRAAACAHRLDHRRVRVPEDHRAPGADVVDVRAAVGVPEPRALGLAR